MKRSWSLVPQKAHTHPLQTPVWTHNTHTEWEKEGDIEKASILFSSKQTRNKTDSHSAHTYPASVCGCSQLSVHVFGSVRVCVCVCMAGMRRNFPETAGRGGLFGFYQAPPSGLLYTMLLLLLLLLLSLLQPRVLLHHPPPSASLCVCGGGGHTDNLYSSQTIEPIYSPMTFLTVIWLNSTEFAAE